MKLELSGLGFISFSRMAGSAFLLALIVSVAAGCGSGIGSTANGASGAAIGGGSVPAKGQPFPDAEFGTVIIRITDKAVDGYSGAGIENEYARSDPENSDGTYLILRGNDGEWYLYDAKTYQMVTHLEGINGGNQEPEPRWDATDPKTFYFLYGMQLRSYNADTGAIKTVHDFSGLDAQAVTISTQTEGDASMNRRYWCFMVHDVKSGLRSLITYDRQADAVLGQKAVVDFAEGLNWVSMDMSGQHCVVGYEDTNGDGTTPPVDVFSRDLSTKVTTLPVGSTGHMDLALDANGRDVMIYQNNATDWIAMTDLMTGAETNLIEIPFSINADIGLHFSGNCGGKPGWVLVSTYGSKNPPDGSTHSWMDNLVFLMPLKAGVDKDHDIRYLARTNAYTSLDFTGDKNYFAEAFAAINTSGTRVYFGSNWSDFSNMEYSDVYVINAK